MRLTNHFTAPNNCKLAVWKIEESEEDLEKNLPLTLGQRQALATRKTVNGRQGYLAVRSALVSLGIRLEELITTEEGIPQLPEGFCSLSHSDQYAAAVYAQEKVGIDVEAYRPKILRIAKKFTHKNELAFLKNLDQIKALTRLWTAKEAIYKALKKAGLSFSEQIELMPFDLYDPSGSAKVYLEEQLCTVQLQFSTFDQHELTIAHTLQYESIN
jgi:phosphopantetheinyl transferase